MSAIEYICFCFCDLQRVVILSEDSALAPKTEISISSFDLGVKDYCERYGKNIVRVCEEEGGPRPFEGRTMNEIHQAMCKLVPVEKLDERRKWRDERLGELSKLGSHENTKQ